MNRKVGQASRLSRETQGEAQTFSVQREDEAIQNVASHQHDAAQIWPLPAASLDQLTELGPSSNSQGVDGIFKTVLKQSGLPAVTGHCPDSRAK